MQKMQMQKRAAKKRAAGIAGRGEGRSTKEKKEVQPIGSFAVLAELVSRDVSTVTRWAKREDWPFSRKPPWARGQVPEVLRWSAETIGRGRIAEDEDAAADGLLSALTDGGELKELKKEKLRKEIRKLLANAEQAEVALAKERASLLVAVEVEREWGSIAAVVRNGFQNLASQIVPLALGHGMPQQGAAEFASQVEQAVAGVLRHLSRDGKEEELNHEGAKGNSSESGAAESPATMDMAAE